MVRPAKYFWNLSSAVLVAGLMMFVQPAFAATVGQAVAAIGDDPGGGTVGSTEFSPLLGGDAIKYFIPLSGSPGTFVTYGVDGGTLPDSGNGGSTLIMNLAFKGVNSSQAGVLKIFFEDLDLSGANDPPGFLESIQVFDSSLAPLTPLIEDINSLLVSGDGETQQLLSLSLGVLGSDPYWVQLAFRTISDFNGTNTPEYLIAEISAVPLPAALPLFLAALAGLGLYRRRRQRKLMALQHG